MLYGMTYYIYMETGRDPGADSRGDTTMHVEQSQHNRDTFSVYRYYKLIDRAVAERVEEEVELYAEALQRVTRHIVARDGATMAYRILVGAKVDSRRHPMAF